MWAELNPLHLAIQSVACPFMQLYGLQGTALTHTGHAWLDVLSGSFSPAGKLPLTLPISEDDVVPPCTKAECSWMMAPISRFR